MIAAKIGELKNKLSAYLREVKDGHEIIIMDRDTPIAKMVPYSSTHDDFVIREPRGSLADWKTIPKVKIKKKIDILKVLREQRDEDRLTLYVKKKRPIKPARPS